MDGLRGNKFCRLLGSKYTAGWKYCHKAAPVLGYCTITGRINSPNSY